MTHPTVDEPLKVSGKTDPGKLAKSISMTLQEREDGRLKVRAMGPHSVNQAIKGLIIARQLLAATGLDIDIVPVFDTHREAEADVTVIVFLLELIEV